MKKIKAFVSFIRFLFFPYTDRDNEIREWLQKEKQAIEMLENLHGRYTEMGSGDIIDELYRIHNFHRVPDFPFWDKRSLYFYNILSELERRSRNEELSDDYLQLVLDMLFWEEVKLRLDRSSPLCIVGILESNPHSCFREELEKHLEFIENLLKRERWGTHYRADIVHEVIRVEGLLKRCSEI